MALNYKGGLSRYRRYLQTAQERPMVQASLFVTLSLLLVIGLLVLALRPTLITIAELLGQTKTYGQTSEQLNAKIVAVGDALTLMDDYRSDLPLIDEALPDRAEWLGWAESVEAMASSSGIRLDQMEVGPAQIAGREVTRPKGTAVQEARETLPEGVTAIDFKVAGTGNYEQMRTFLVLLEGKRRMAVLSKVQISKEETGELTLIVDGEIGYRSVPQTTP